MISGTDSGSGGISPETKRQLVKIVATALVGIISAICGIEIGVSI